MKPGIINTTNMNEEQINRIAKWLTANGCRHYVPRWTRIIYTGTRIIAPTFNIERIGQKKKAWARSIHAAHLNAGLATKVRTFRERVPYEEIR